ncbi:MAG: class I SAM-dependent methyltransferase [Minisyncoccia bacterium]
MLFKVDWLSHLHNTRKKEIDIIFDYFGNLKFDSGLELGAGDGFQTSILSSHLHKLISADLNFDRIKIKIPSVEYIKCDADRIGGFFREGQFDIIFTSSLLEHLSDLEGFLKNSKVFLKDDGFSVHVVPNRFMKIAYLVMFYPNLFLLILDRVVGVFKGKKVFQGNKNSSENNINSANNTKSNSRFSKYKKVFFPSIHGNYSSHYEEFIKWGKGHWRITFKKAGYKIVTELPTSVHSGYGFGFDSVRRILEKFGFSSLTIFILKK